jgi:hypothetical protein
VPGEQPVELIGELLPVAARAVAGRRLYAARAQLVHEIAHRQPLANGVRRVELAARVERVAAALDHLRRERNVGGHHEIARLDPARDLAVGDVEPARHLERADEGRARRAQRLVGDQRNDHLRALGRAVEDVLHHGRTGVGVDPDVHRTDSRRAAQS